MSKYLSVLLLSLLAPALVAQSQTPPKAVSPKPDYSTEAFVIEQTSTKVKFENDGSSVHEDTARIRVQSDAGVQRYGLLTFSYASATGTYDIDYVRVRKPDGTVVVTPPDNVQDMAAQITREAPFYSDLREKHVAVKGLGIGDVLEFQTHERVTKPLAPGQFWLDYSFSRNVILLQEQLEVSVPRERAIKIKSPEIKPNVSEAGQYRVYSWTSSNLQRQDETKEKEKQDQTKTALEQVRGRSPQPDLLISSFQSWEEVGRWYGGLQEERIKPTPEIQAKAAELTKGAVDDDAKLRAIYKYVSQQFRYIGVAFGIGRYQPHSASSVLDNQYGDCKDKHTLLASLLSAAGIRAYPVLLSTVREIDADMPSPVEFNHVITVVPRPSGLVWLDTTAEVGPFQYLIPTLRDKHALVIWDDKPPALVSTPVDFPFPSTQAFRMQAKLDDAGTLEGNAVFTARGDLEYALRSAFRSVALPQWKELAQRVSYSFGFGGDVSEVTASSPENTDEPFHFAYKYTRKEFGDWANRRILAPSPAIGMPQPSDDNAPPPVPLWLGPPTEITFHSELEIPHGYTPEPAAAIHLKYSFAEFDSVYAFKDGMLISDRHLRTINREVPPGAYADFKKLHKVVQDDYSAFIPLSSPTASPGQSLASGMSALQKSVLDLPDSTDPEATRLMEAARDAVSRRDIQGAVSSLYRAVAADPKFTKARVMLGAILLSTNQTDAGLEAFNKAISADPEHAVVRKLLGYSLMAASKFEEAVPVWQEYIKIAPDDVDGPGNLESALFNLKRYPEAASALEAALKLHPEWSNIQWQLASAYLRAGNDEKAVGALRKFIELNPRPEMLNDAAYEMAEADKLLPLALEYAEKAVRAEEEASTKIDFSKLQLADLAHAHILSSFWDTLGWTQNRVSKLDLSEKYLNASWRLSQNGVVAAHLCHVYDRLHKTTAAIQMCRMALHRLTLADGPGMYRAPEEADRTRAFLDHLIPSSSESQDLNAVLDPIIKLRTFKLARLVTGTETAEFFVLLVSDPKTMTFKAQDWKFIKGSEKLKPAGKALLSISYNLPTPDAVPSRVVRRGVLGCYQYSGCEFVLLDPDSAQALD